MVMAAIDTVFTQRRGATQSSSSTVVPSSSSRVGHLTWRGTAAVVKEESLLVNQGALQWLPLDPKYKPDIYANSAQTKSSVSVNSEVVSETEDETQPPLLVMPTLTADDLFDKVEQYVADLKRSRAKDLADCQQLELALLQYKAACIKEKTFATQAISGKLHEVQAIIQAVMTDLPAV